MSGFCDGRASLNGQALISDPTQQQVFSALPKGRKALKETFQTPDLISRGFLLSKIGVMARAKADRSSGDLKVTCPVCGHVHDFSDWDSMEIFICESCAEPVEVDEIVQ